MKPLRILHLSDLHERDAFEGMPQGRQPKLKWDANQRGQVLGQRFFDSLSEFVDGGVDIVCFTGDLSDWGHPAEYAKADARIAAILERLGVPREHFFAVPGNHDVQRRIQEAAWQGIRNWLANTPDGAARIGRWLHHVEGPPPGVVNSWREELTERTAAFWNWLDSFGRPDLRPCHPTPFGYRQSLAAGTFAHVLRPLHIIGLDSAWLCGSDHDQGKILLTEEQVEAHIFEGGSKLDGFCIALVHHPLDHLADHHPVRRLLADGGVDILLHGHQHTPLVMVADEPGARLRIIASGCLIEGDIGKGWPNGFNLLEVDTGDGSGAVHFRKWARDGRFWAIGSDIYRDAPHGTLTFGPANGEVTVARHNVSPRDVVSARLSIFEAYLAQRPAWEAAATSTLADGTVQLRVCADGSWKGGIDGIRPIVIRLLRLGNPVREVHVLHEHLMNLCREYLALEGAASLTIQEGRRSDVLRSQLTDLLANAARMATAIRVVFMPSTKDVRFSIPGEVGLDIERGVAFIDALLKKAHLAPSTGKARTIYHPQFVESLWTDTSIEDQSAADFRTRWEGELRGRFVDFDASSARTRPRYSSTRRMYDLTLVPGWALSYEQVAVYMLPAVVWSILRNLDLSDAPDINAVRQRTEKAFPALPSREVWNVHAWAVALEATNLKDLTFASHPPRAAHELK